MDNITTTTPQGGERRNGYPGLPEYLVIIRNARLQEVVARSNEEFAYIAQHAGGAIGRFALEWVGANRRPPTQLMMNEAARHARFCGRCGRDIAPDALVFRFDAGLVCGECGPAWLTEGATTWPESYWDGWWGDRLDKPHADMVKLLKQAKKNQGGILRSAPFANWWIRYVTCRNCERPVVIVDERMEAYCCDNCRFDWYNVKRRVETQYAYCATCGDIFAQSRSDARYCSNACRQKAFRDRAASNTGAPQTS